MAIFTVEDLTFSYPNTEKCALSHISFSVEQGEIFLICGASGCGKSTLLRHFKSCLTPHGMRSGKVMFGENELFTYSNGEQARRIGFVSQHADDQIVTDKVWHELAFGMESLGTKQEVMRLRIAEMASYFGIQNWFYKNVAELSGGQKQLLNLASVMVMNPDVIVLDEPTSQLDPIAATEFLNTLKKINSELGITIILTEHRLEEAFSMADRVLVMENGMVAVIDTPQKAALSLVKGSDIYYALPTAAKVFTELESNTQYCPLTVKEGRQYLLSRNMRPAKLDCSKTVGKGEKLLELKECWFRYSKDGKDVLKGLSLCAYRGEIFAVVGGNGTGKSTMLSVISGVNRVYRGKILLNGKLMRQTENNAVKIGALPQDPRTLFVKETVLSDLSQMLDGLKKSEEKQKRLNDVVKQMQLEQLLEKHPYDLSGGEQQRVAIAKVLLMQPDILLLDEPTKGMDAHFKEGFGKMLKELATQGIAIIMVSHDIEFCAKYSNRCGLFFDGCITTENTPREFFYGNHFYTTAANRMARFVFENAVLAEEVVALCKTQTQEK